MTDHGQDVRFGLFPTPSAGAPELVLELAALADVSGLDLVSIQDHPYQRAHLDMWTLLSFIGARTSSIRLSPNVVSLPLRPPVILAKAAASLDLLTGGRVELGLGAGAFWDPIVAAGGARRSPKEAVDALVEAITVLRAFWAGGTVHHDGEHYPVRGLKAGPTPAHEIPIWLGAYKPRMLRLTGQLADAWVPSMGYADPPALADLNARIDEAALAAGRAPQAIRRIYNIFGRFGTGSGYLQGTVTDWVEQLAELVLSEGMDTFILGTDDPAMVQRFAGEVAPAVRELVAAEREGAARTAPEVPDSHDATVAATTTALTVTPTPDDGTRLTGELAWDEASRPTYPVPAGTAYRAAQLAQPQHLIDVHDQLRAELEQVRDIVRQVREGHLQVGAARSAINTMALRQNNWTLGAYCESYCRIVTGHHTLEDRGMFPHLRAADPDAAPVLDRLEQEHHVISAVIDELDRALVRLVESSAGGSRGAADLANVEAAVDKLTDTLLSHLSYEERELLHPLARHGLT